MRNDVVEYTEDGDVPPQFKFMKYKLGTDGNTILQSCSLDDPEGSWLQVSKGVPRKLAPTCKRHFKQRAKRIRAKLKLKVGEM